MCRPPQFFRMQKHVGQNCEHVINKEPGFQEIWKSLRTSLALSPVLPSSRKLLTRSSAASSLESTEPRTALNAAGHRLRLHSSHIRLRRPPTKSPNRQERVSDGLLCTARSQVTKHGVLMFVPSWVFAVIHNTVSKKVPRSRAATSGTSEERGNNSQMQSNFISLCQEAETARETIWSTMSA